MCLFDILILFNQAWPVRKHLDDWLSDDVRHRLTDDFLSGEVEVGEGVWLGTGAAVIQCLRIGEWTYVGAGAVVVEDLPPRVMAYGVPARPVRPVD